MTDHAKTEDLIRALAASPPPARLDGPRAVGLLLGAVVAALGVFFAVFGPRPDLAAVLPRPEVLAKILLPLALAGPALGLALRAARPGQVLRLWVLAVPAVLALMLFGLRLAETPPGAVGQGIMGGTALACLLSITLMSAPAILLGIVLLRRGAALRPGLSGALVGLGASAAVTAGYALHCTEDSPLFFTIWYGLAILICCGAGALAGLRWLRW